MTSNPPDVFDVQGLRQALGRFATGVTVITAGRPGGARIGLTCNSFNAVSLSPPLVLWSLRHASRSYDAFAQSSSFAVNILAADQEAVARRFALQVDDRFAGFEWEVGLEGLPLLVGASAVLECRREAIHAGGDHGIFIGRVLRLRHSERPPLLYLDGCYADAVPRSAGGAT